MANRRRTSINTDISAGLCFGCGRNNPFGLKLSFKWDGKTARAEFIPTKFYQGWPGVVHGGIITSMLDEAMAYAARFGGANCITARMQIKFGHPALIDEPLIVTASISKNGRRVVETKANIALRDGTLVAESTATQFVIETSPNNEEEKSQSNA